MNDELKDLAEKIVNAKTLLEAKAAAQQILNRYAAEEATEESSDDDYETSYESSYDDDEDYNSSY